MNSLREALWSSDSPPGSDVARERVIQRTTEELRSDRRPDRGRLAPGIMGVAAGLLILLVATPQGRDAASWAAGLVGVGEVGGPPASVPSERAPEASRGPIVFATGIAPDGKRFELFAYRSEQVNEIPGGATCVQTKLVDSDIGSAPVCFGGGPTEEGVRIYEFSETDLADGYGVLAGEVNLVAERVVVSYRTEGGDGRTVESTVADLDGQLGERIAIPNPTSFFVAFLPGASEIDEACAFDISVRALDGAGQELARDDLDAGCGQTAVAERAQSVDAMRRACEGENLGQPTDSLSSACAQALQALRASE